MVEYVDEEGQGDEKEVCEDEVLHVMKMIDSYLLHGEVGCQFQLNLAVTDLEG